MVTLCRLFGMMLCGHTDLLLGLLWPLGPGEEECFSISAWTGGLSQLCWDSWCKPLLAPGLQLSHAAPGCLHAQPLPQTLTEGQNLACGTSARPGLGFFLPL